MSEKPSASRRVELRRYPNRRYYDRARSQHLTLEKIHRLVRDGCEVQIIDSKTDEDITARTLAHIILEHDPVKLAAVPVELLHQIIRCNELLLRDFLEKYFNRALAAFVKSQEEFERYLGQALGLYGVPTMGRDWARMTMSPFVRALLAGGNDADAADQAEARDPPASEVDLRQMVEEVKQQVAALRRELERR